MIPFTALPALIMGYTELKNLGKLFFKKTSNESLEHQITVTKECLNQISKLTNDPKRRQLATQGYTIINPANPLGPELTLAEAERLALRNRAKIEKLEDSILCVKSYKYLTGKKSSQ